MRSAVRILVSLSLFFFASTIGSQLMSREPSQEELKLEDFEPRKEPEKEKPKTEKLKPKPKAKSKREKAQAVKSAEKVWEDPATGMAFVWVPGGCFRIGCGPWAGECGDDNKSVKDVCVDGFWIGKYEVTQAQWEKVMRSNPSQFKKGPNYPVEQVSWNDAKEFIQKLIDQNGKKYTFRLPTEAEWEFACRSGGKNEKFSGGDDVDKLAWFVRNSGNETHEVGKKGPNGLGVFDMSGNIREWCEDAYDKDAYSELGSKNPVNTDGSSSRVIRGGSWVNSIGHVSCTYRSFTLPASRSSNIALRLVKKD